MPLTAQEKSTGEPTSASSDLAKQTLGQQGFVVPKAVLAAVCVAAMRETFTGELQNHYASNPQTLANADQEERRTLLALVYYRQYAMPDNLVALTEPISTSDWLQLSERMRWTYRLTRTQTK